MNLESSQQNDFFISQRILHPDYNPEYKYHDIGLVQLNDDAAFSHTIWPACLVKHHELTEHQRKSRSRRE